MRRILHIFNHRAEWDDIDDVCDTVVRCLDTLDDVEQRIFSPSHGGHPGRFAMRLRGEIREFRPGFVHLHAPNPVATVCLPGVLPRGVKLVIHWHEDPRYKKILKPLETALLRRADVIIGTSLAYIEHSQPLGPFLSKCVVIPPAIDVTRLIPSPTRLDKIRWRYGDKPLLLFTGRHLPYKGLEVLMEAVEAVEHDCRLMVGGEGPSTERLKRDHASERIHFAGPIPREDLAAWYTAADLFLFPSTTREEAFGIALAEAMWCGTPAVTFTIPGSGVNWVSLNGVTGIEVDNGNAEQLAAAIDHLLTHDDMRHEYGRAARRRISDHMTSGLVSRKLEEVYS
ncbi:MAG: glycosyltransferase [Alistipes sp.]|jgi:glycosyltransferase involved in cell wall biosynthesis|nr:glycosyltransferase [Alistipes sp.]